MILPMSRADRSAACVVAAAFLAWAPGSELAAQESTNWYPRLAAGGMRVIGPGTPIRMQRAMPLELPPGGYHVHFPRDAAGKPDSLQVTAPPGSTLAIAVAPGTAAAPIELAPGQRDYMVRATATAEDSGGAWGLVARRRDDDNWYRFVWDRERGEFRFERALGGDAMVIRSAPGPVADDRAHELAFQVEGFRLHAWFDDELVLQALDGAHGEGGHDTWSHASQVEFENVRVEPPTAARASSVIVRVGPAGGLHDDADAELRAATAHSGGHWYVVELALDRPHPLLPKTVAGLEPWLLHGPVAPTVLLGDIAGNFGVDLFGQVPADGRISALLRFPSGPAIAGRSVLVRALVVTPDGDRLASRTPAVATQI